MTTSRAIMMLAVLVSLGVAASWVLAQDQVAEGEKLFRARCGACHSVEPGRNRMGPHLAGVIGRPAGSVAGARYSRALQDSRVVWNEQTLDNFLANPKNAVPGTTMPVAVPDAKQRAAIIAYLKSLDSAS